MSDIHDPKDPAEETLPRRRPWGPASYWRSGIVLLALIVALILAFQIMSGVPTE